ncbi:MAG: HopJ type III effector protein [Burkholderiaceae bacterium]
MTSPQELITSLNQSPETLQFADVIAVIDGHYEYTPSAFSNGELSNAAGTNEGSCKVLYFAQLHGLDQQQTLALFAQYYRDDVLKNPDGTDHGNIRNFMKTGWPGVRFEQTVLV